MGSGVPINLYIWCAVGAAVGWVAAGVAGGGPRTLRIESVLVGVFAAVAGGDVVAAFLTGVKIDESSFSLPALLAAAVCAVGGVLLLGLVRRLIGPQKISKPTNRNR